MSVTLEHNRDAMCSRQRGTRTISNLHGVLPRGWESGGGGGGYGAFMHDVTLGWRLGKNADSVLCERDCVKVEAAVQGSPSLIVLQVSVDVEQPLKKSKE